jgi:hypothetical protein
MPFEALLDPRYTDVVLEERPFNVSREIITVNNATGGAVPQGTIVWRAIGTNPAAAYDLIDATGEVSASNEYAILIGDDFSPKESITLAAGAATTCIALVRDARVKEFKLKAAQLSPAGALNDAQFASLKHLMARQYLLVEPSLTPIYP